MLKENAMYEKDEAATDVALTSKDMEVNFSGKQNDEDEEGMEKLQFAELGDARLIKADSMDIIEESDLKGVVQGVPEEIKIVEKMKILEEQKKGGGGGAVVMQKQTPGRSKLVNGNKEEPKIQTPLTKKE
jgi:hypothetical protein